MHTESPPFKKNELHNKKVITDEGPIESILPAVPVAGDDGIFLNCKFHGQTAVTLFDSGCSADYVSEDFYNRLSNRPYLKNKGGKVFGVHETLDTEILGEFTTEVRIGNLIFKTRIGVMRMNVDAIIGIRTMKKLGIDPLPSKNVVILRNPGMRDAPGTHRKLVSEALPVSTAKLIVRRTVLVPARTEMMVPTSIYRRGPIAAQSMIEPTRHFTVKNGKNLLAAPGLINTPNSCQPVPVRVLNATDEPHLIHPDTFIATLSACPDDEDVSLIENPMSVPGSDNEKNNCVNNVPATKLLPEKLKKLFEESSEFLSSKDQKQLAELLLKFQDVFGLHDSDMGTTNVVQHTIEIGEHPPISQPLRRAPMHKAHLIDEEVEEMLKKEIIVPSNSPWASPVVMTTKKDGKPRVCIDYRKLNDITIKDAHPLPRIDETLDHLYGSKWFSTFDLMWGYWQVSMSSKDKEKTAFRTRKGLFEFNVMPFGLCNAPATFSRLMEIVLKSLHWTHCLVYLDDIIIFSSTVDQHLERLRLLFTRLRESNLKLKPSKCHLFKKQVAYLGHIISEEGIKTDPSKIDKVQDWPRPSTVKQVRSFLGLCAYYRRFVKDFGDIAKPLYDLTRKGHKWKWTTECQTAFILLKRHLTTSPILGYVNETDPFILDTDASEFGIGAVLSQVQNGVEKVIAYGSRSLKNAELNYCVTRKEMLALVFFVRHFRHYLAGRPFLVRTDHGSLRWLLNLKDPVGQNARWFEILGEFDFKVEHRPGSKHGNADGMSRIPCKQCGRQEKENVELRVVTRSKSKKAQETLPTVSNSTPLPKEKEIKPAPRTPRRKQVKKQEKPEEMSPIKVEQDVSPAPKTVPPTVINKKRGRPPRTTSEASLSKSTLPKGSQPITLPSRKSPIPEPTTEELAKFDLEQENLGKDYRWITPYSLQQLYQLQSSDPVIGKVKEWTLAKKRPPWKSITGASPAVKILWRDFDKLETYDGIIYRRTHLCQYNQDVLQLLLPLSLRKLAFECLHDSPLGGHFGHHRTEQSCYRRVYWHGMKYDIKRWIRTCDLCCKNKPSLKNKKAPLQQLPVGNVFERIAIDIKGPYPISKRGNKVIMVVSDYFTKWVQAIPLPDDQAKTVASALVERVICLLGTPMQIHTDCGRNFESKLFRQLCDFLRIKKTRTVPYHPQSDGLVERFNRTLGTLLRLYTNSHQDDWDEHLPYLMMAYRSTIHDSTGYSPNYLMLGREVMMPLDAMFPNPFTNKYYETVESYTEQLQERFRNAYTHVRENLKKSAERQKKQYDLVQNLEIYKPNDKVLVKIYSRKKGVSPKLEPQWKGPCTILEKIGAVNYQIQIPPKRIVKIVHHDQLKPYTPPEEDQFRRVNTTSTQTESEELCFVMDHFSFSEKLGPFEASTSLSQSAEELVFSFDHFA